MYLKSKHKSKICSYEISLLLVYFVLSQLHVGNAVAVSLKHDVLPLPGKCSSVTHSTQTSFKKCFPNEELRKFPASNL